MTGPIVVDRARWLGYRWREHGLGGRCGDAALDRLLTLGFQDTRQVGAVQALAQRTTKVDGTGVADAVSADGPLVALWSVRVAPHAYRPGRLDFVRDALAPRDADEGGPAHVEAVEEVAAALGAVVRAPMPKGEASGEVTGRVRPALVEWCPRCEARHVPDRLFREAGRQARLVLDPDRRPGTVLRPPPDHPQEKVDRPRLALLTTYLRVNGPVSRPVYRDWLGGAAAVADLWKDLGDLVRVEIDGHRYDLPEELLDPLRAAPGATGVALVPPNDPYVRQTDRTLLVPDRERRQEALRALSGPGTLLVDGEVAGTWRYRRGRHEVAVTAFERVTPARRAEAERNAELVVGVLGDDRPKVTWD
ncbi:crosslink repair DNA glycosylase YcaQ family protein [Sphaerisporangium sp. B11E5]|uniref:DNA glycosylase AlkZ-like family protein n=1 Tax=Sphaerisporangium sp. B11E5 TaxID=3153563 RepID=UPI00325D89D9